MALDKLVLIIVVVLVAAAATIGIAIVLAAALQIPYGGVVLLPGALVAYIVWRLLADRIGNAEDDHYDRMER